MAGLHIAADFDEVLRPFLAPLEERYNSKHGTKFSLDQHKTYEFDDVWQVSREVVIEEIDDYISSPEHLKVDPFPFIWESVSRLKASGHELTVVTARPDEVAEYTEEWIRRRLPNIFEEVVYCSHGARPGEATSKEAVLLEREMDVLVDDSPGHVKKVLNNGLEGILYGDYPWNSLVHHRSGINRLATDWLAVEAHIEEIEEGDGRL